MLHFESVLLSGALRTAKLDGSTLSANRCQQVFKGITAIVCNRGPPSRHKAFVKPKENRLGSRVETFVHSRIGYRFPLFKKGKKTRALWQISKELGVDVLRRDDADRDSKLAPVASRTTSGEGGQQSPMPSDLSSRKKHSSSLKQNKKKSAAYFAFLLIWPDRPVPKFIVMLGWSQPVRRSVRELVVCLAQWARLSIPSTGRSVITRPRKYCSKSNALAALSMHGFEIGDITRKQSEIARKKTKTKRQQRNGY